MVDIDVHICITQFSLMALRQGALVAKSAHIVEQDLDYNTKTCLKPPTIP